MPALDSTRSESTVEFGRRKSLLVHFSYYTGSRYAAEFLFLLRGFILARVLGPAWFGVWTQMKIALTFLQFSQLGAHEAMMREVPYFAGKGDEGRGDAIKRAVLGFNLISSLCVAGLLVFAVLFQLQGTGAPRTPWLFFACVFPLSQLFWYVHVRCRAEREFGYVAVMLVAFSLASTVTGVVAALRYGLEGFLLALAGSYLLALVGGRIGEIRLGRPSWSPAILREMIRIGFPMMVSSAMLMLLWNVDKLSIWILLDAESLGIYALPAYLVLSVTMLPEAVSAVLYPRLMNSIATAKSTSFVETYLTRPTLVISHLVCPLLGVLFLAIHVPIHWLFPRYLLSVTPGKILIAVVFFMLITRVPYVILLSLNRQKLLSALAAISVVVAGVFVVGFLKAGTGLAGAAAGVGIGFFLYSSLLMTATVGALRMRPPKIASFLFATLAPYAVTAATVALVLAFIPEAQLNAGADLGYTALRCAIVVAVCSTLLWATNSRLRFLRREPLI